MTDNCEVIPLDAVLAAYRDDPAMTQQRWVTWAAECAERALPHYEEKYPDDKRPRKAIEAARAWAADPTEENRKEARSATADAAKAAVHACGDATAYATANAAYAAACTAKTAYAAVNAAVNAAAHAACAATHVAACANPTNPDKAKAAERQWQALRLSATYHGGVN